MRTRYDERVKSVFKTIKSPHPKFIVDMIEYPDHPSNGLGYLSLRVYRDNVESFSDPQKVVLAEYLYQLRDAIRDLGVNCHIEGVEHAPPNRRR